MKTQDAKNGKEQYALSIFISSIPVIAGGLSITRTKHYVSVVLAHSENEAVGIGIKLAMNSFPPHEGWDKHDVVALKVPPIDKTPYDVIDLKSY